MSDVHEEGVSPEGCWTRGSFAPWVICTSALVSPGWRGLSSGASRACHSVLIAVALSKT